MERLKVVGFDVVYVGVFRYSESLQKGVLSTIGFHRAAMLLGRTIRLNASTEIASWTLSVKPLKFLVPRKVLHSLSPSMTFFKFWMES